MPGKAKTGIRFRIDGTPLQPYIEVPAQFRQTMVTRLKIMCDLDISEKRKPKTARSSSKIRPTRHQCVATIPSSGGVETWSYSGRRRAIPRKLGPPHNKGAA
jgi:type II secretory ATPase GspE/PulE/Tfp pilus assembly ATPase PilB-like protein